MPRPPRYPGIRSIMQNPDDGGYSDDEYEELFEEMPYDEYAESEYEYDTAEMVPYSGSRGPIRQYRRAGDNYNHYQPGVGTYDTNSMGAAYDYIARDQRNAGYSNRLYGPNGRRLNWLRRDAQGNRVQTSRPVGNTFMNRAYLNAPTLPGQDPLGTFYEEEAPLTINHAALEDYSREHPHSRVYSDYQDRQSARRQRESDIPRDVDRGTEVPKSVKSLKENQEIEAELHRYKNFYDVEQEKKEKRERSVRQFPSITRPNASGKDGVVTFSNTEYVQNVLSNTTAYALIQVSVNPGLYNSFPVLSQIASCFVYYRFKKLKFRFVSTTNDSMSASGTSVALGSVCMTHDPNVTVPAPSNYVLLANYPGAKTFKPSLNVSYEIDCSKHCLDWYFVRTNPTYFNNGNVASVLPLSGQSSNTLAQNIFGTPGAYGSPGVPNIPSFINNLGAPSMVDFVNFYIAAEGNNFSAVVGELWVDYELELSQAFLNGSVGGNQCLYYRAQIGTAGGINSNDGLVCPLVQGHGNVPISVDSNGSVINVKFPAYISSGVWEIKIIMSNNCTGWGASKQAPFILWPPGGTTGVYSIVAPHCWNNTNISGTNFDVYYEMSNGIGQVTSPSVWDNNVYAVGSGGGSWENALCMTVYVQITGSPCTVSFTLLVGATAPTLWYQGSLSVAQMNPNFQYGWLVGGGQNVP